MSQILWKSVKKLILNIFLNNFWIYLLYCFELSLSWNFFKWKCVLKAWFTHIACVCSKASLLLSIVIHSTKDIALKTIYTINIGVTASGVSLVPSPPHRVWHRGDIQCIQGDSSMCLVFARHYLWEVYVTAISAQLSTVACTCQIVGLSKNLL